MTMPSVWELSRYRAILMHLDDNLLCFAPMGAYTRALVSSMDSAVSSLPSCACDIHLSRGCQTLYAPRNCWRCGSSVNRSHVYGQISDGVQDGSLAA